MGVMGVMGEMRDRREASRLRRRRVVWTAVLGVLLLGGSCVVAGRIRRPLDRTYLVAIGQSHWVYGRNWSLLGPVWHSYVVGASGTIWQVRGPEIYAITVHRYLNCLPDCVGTPRLVASDWPVTRPSAAR